MIKRNAEETELLNFYFPSIFSIKGDTFWIKWKRISNPKDKKFQMGEEEKSFHHVICTKTRKPCKKGH